MIERYCCRCQNVEDGAVRSISTWTASRPYNDGFRDFDPIISRSLLQREYRNIYFFLLRARKSMQGTNVFSFRWNAICARKICTKVWKKERVTRILWYVDSMRIKCLKFSLKKTRVKSSTNFVHHRWRNYFANNWSLYLIVMLLHRYKLPYWRSFYQ